MARPAGKKDARARQLARLHCLKAELMRAEPIFNDESYRNLLFGEARVDSAAELDEHGRNRIINLLQGRLHAIQRHAAYPGRPNNTDTRKRAELKKIEALLTDADLGWEYAAGIARHMTKGRKQRLEFCSLDELVAVLAALHRAAIKRLSKELQAAFGEAWREYGSHAATLLFDFDSTHRTFESYPEAMSRVLRWCHGKLPVVCEWPADLQRGQCCMGCAHRGRAAAEVPA